MKNHDREPIEETCPIIDSLLLEMDVLKFRNLQSIKVIKSNNATDSLIRQLIENNLKLNDFKNVIEQLRTANKSLRQWGLKEAREVDMLIESYVKPLLEKEI